MCTKCIYRNIRLERILYTRNILFTHTLRFTLFAERYTIGDNLYSELLHAKICGGLCTRGYRRDGIRVPDKVRARGWSGLRRAEEQQYYIIVERVII